MDSDCERGAGRYFTLCQRHVAEQRRRVLRLEQRGMSTAAARDLLQTFEYALAVATEIAGARSLLEFSSNQDFRTSRANPLVMQCTVSDGEHLTG